jgi:hypothetical protein
MHAAFSLQPGGADLVALRPGLLFAGRHQLHAARVIQFQAAPVDPAMGDQGIQHRLA